MTIFTLDTILLGAFLGINLVVGIWYGIRTKDIRSYAIGSKNFSTPVVTGTIVATYFGGGFMFYTLANVYSKGLYYIISAAGGPICLLLYGWLAVRMGAFLDNLSVAEAMGDLYGKLIRIITAVSGICITLGPIAAQFIVIPKILALVFGIEGTWVSITVATAVVAYSAFGGIKAVTHTDIIQFITFSIFIPILALVIWNNLKDPSQVAHTLATNPNFSFRKVVGYNPQFVSSLSLMLFFALPTINPAMFQRIAMAGNIKQAQSSYQSAAGIVMLVILAVVWIGILLLAANPTLEPDTLVNYLIQHYSYPGLKGLIGVGIIALAMSTADSYLHASSVLFVHDIIKPLWPSFKNSLKIVRIFAFVSGAGALVLSLHIKDILSTFKTVSSFYNPIVSVPLLLAIFGFRSSPRAVLIGMVAGFTAVVSWNFFSIYPSIDSFIPGIVCNLIFFLGSHYLLKEKGGWKGVKKPASALAAKQTYQTAWKIFINAIKQPRLYSYLQKNLPKEENLYSLFGLYVIGAIYISFYTVSEEVVTLYQKLYDFITHSVLIATAGFLTYPAWPSTFKDKRFIAFSWPLGIFYILFFAGSVLVVMSGFHQVQVMVFMLNLVIGTLLLSWQLVLALAISGILVSVVIFDWHAGSVPLAEVTSSLQFKLIYGVLLFSSFLIALTKFKQSKEKLQFKNLSLLATSQETTSELLVASKDRVRFTKAFQASGAPDLARLVGLSRDIVEKAKGLNIPQELTQEITQLHEQLTPIALHLDRLDHRAAGYLRLEVATITIDGLLEAVQEKLHARELAKRISWKKVTKHKEVECDVARLASLLVNCVSLVRSVADTDMPILIGIEDTKLGYPMSSVKPDYTKKVAALRITLTTASMLPAMEEYYLAQMSEDIAPIPETITDLPLVANERILKAHYGYTSTFTTGKDLTQVYVVPVQLREVRPKDMDLPEMELGAKIVRADDTYLGAQEQEAAFLQAVQERTQADLKLIGEAIELIKQYHGPVRRKSGEPFYLHPLAVAHIVLDYNQDEATVLGALLHDIVEDTSLTLDQIAVHFNEEVKGIVNGVTHLNSHKDTFYKVKFSSHENIRMLLGVEDKRVLYVKTADRLHNMRTIQYKSYKSQWRIAEETLLFFVPLAEQLGLKEVAAEFKELCF